MLYLYNRWKMELRSRIGFRLIIFLQYFTTLKLKKMSELYVYVQN